MNEVSVVLPDGSHRKVPSPATLGDVAKSIGPGLLKVALAGKINGQPADLSDPVAEGDRVEITTATSDAGLEIIRHSTAHLLAMAVQELYPGTQITIGPVVENQFYYDILPPHGTKIGSGEFPAIEAKMRQIAERDLPVTKKVVPRKDAIAYFHNLGEAFKVEIVGDIPADQDIKIYEIGGAWGDLCRGPHVPSTGKLGAFKLMNVSGAFWRANKDNAQLTRIYGTAWANKKDLDAYLNMLEEAKKRDHLVLGKQLDLFSMHPDVAVGAPFFLPNGAKIFGLLVSYMRKKMRKYGFQEVQTPQIMNVNLWKTSGHWEHYRENMYTTKIDELDYAVKPMNCPAHVKIFMTGLRSYRELPLRLGEFGVVHRHELSGVVHGLTRVRRFMQDDGHIFCTLEQADAELRSALRLVQEVYGELGFPEVKYYLSTRPNERAGDDAEWDVAEGALEKALKAEGIPFQINPGDGAFYGPKIDFKVKDAIGRMHQCATIQLDSQVPKRFGATFQSKENTHDTPVMIHRAVLGSVERFMGVFIEHTAGHFPLGIAPLQARIMNVTSDQEAYCENVRQTLFDAGVRIDSDLSSDKLSAKIRDAQLKKIPYMLVVGEKEAAAGKLTPRMRDGTNLEPMSVAEFLARVKAESGVFWGLDANQS